MAKHYDYGDASRSHTGIMICAACHKPIAEGDYRYRATTDRFINWHRECCADDPVWLKRDKEAEKLNQRQRDFIAACIDFRDRWQVDDLDEYIAEASEPVR